MQENLKVLVDLNRECCDLQSSALTSTKTQDNIKMMQC